MTNVPISVTARRISLIERDAFGRGYSRKRSESGARARSDTLRSRAAPGIMRAGTTAGAGGAFPGLGQAGAGNARLEARDLRPSVGAGFFGSCALAASQEAWPGAERKGREPPGKSRGGTPTGERVPLDARRIRLMRTGSPCVCRRSASLFFVARMERSVIRGRSTSLNADPGLRSAPSGLRRLIKLGRGSRREKDFHFVIAGLDPAIHAEGTLVCVFAATFAASLHGPPGQARW